jgi:predicted transcriptional regulator
MSKRAENKFKILTTLKNTELCIEDIEMYSNLKRLDIIPVLTALLHWDEVEVKGEETYYLTKKKRKIYTTTEKGEKKLLYLKERYGFTWKPKNAW